MRCTRATLYLGLTTQFACAVGLLIGINCQQLGAAPNPDPVIEDESLPPPSPRVPQLARPQLPTQGDISTADVTGENPERPHALGETAELARRVPIDLPSALRLAGAQNQSLVIAFQRTLAATATQQLAAARLLPNLNGGSNFDGHSGVLQQASGNILNVHRDALYVGAGANAVAAGTVSIPGVQYNLNLSESIFNYLAARPNRERANAMTWAAVNDLQRDVALAYGELLRAEGIRAVLRQIREDAAEVVRVTTAFARTGQGSDTEVQRSTTELKRRDSALAQADAEVGARSAQLVELLNLQGSVRLHAAEPWIVPRPIVPDPITLPELIATAMYRRPELADQRAAVNGAMISLQGARMLPFSPQILAGYSAGNFGGGSNLVASPTPPSGVPPNSPRFGDFAARTDFDAVMYWTLQNLGIGNRAQIDGARARLRSADLERLATLNRVRAEVATAYARKRTQLALLDIRQRAVESSQLAFQQDLARIRGNEGLPIEVLNSLRLLDRARTDYLNTIVDYNQSQFELYWSLGQPPGDLLVRPVEAGGMGRSNGPAAGSHP